MKRVLVVMAMGLFLLLPHKVMALGVKDIEAMHRDGIPDSLVIEKIRHSDKTFHLSTRDLHNLKEAGVSNEVVAAMLQTEDRSPAPASTTCDPWWPYGPPWYVGFDFDYYAPYHRVYAPFHVRELYPGRRFVRVGVGARG